MYFSILILFVAGFVLAWQASLLISALFGAPTVYAKNETIRKAFGIANLKKNQTVIDLGCGNARSLIIASKEFGAKGMGVEVSPFYYMLARLNVRRAGLSDQVKIYYGSISAHQDLIRQADLVYLYLHEKIMKKIEPLIFKNLKKKARIVSLTFRFYKHKTVNQLDAPRIYLYS